MAAVIKVDVENGKMSVTGDVFWGDQQRFQDALDELATSPAKEVVMDFSQSAFLFSSVVALLLTGIAQVEARGKTLRIIIPESLDWLKRYLSQNIPERKFPGVTIEEADTPEDSEAATDS